MGKENIRQYGMLYIKTLQRASQIHVTCDDDFFFLNKAQYRSQITTSSSRFPYTDENTQYL
jgi:hypothetical protein